MTSLTASNHTKLSNYLALLLPHHKPSENRTSRHKASLCFVEKPWVTCKGECGKSFSIQVQKNLQTLDLKNRRVRIFLCGQQATLFTSRSYSLMKNRKEKLKCIDWVFVFSTVVLCALSTVWVNQHMFFCLSPSIGMCICIVCLHVYLTILERPVGRFVDSPLSPAKAWEADTM